MAGLYIRFNLKQNYKKCSQSGEFYKFNNKTRRAKRYVIKDDFLNLNILLRLLQVQEQMSNVRQKTISHPGIFSGFNFLGSDQIGFKGMCSDWIGPDYNFRVSDRI